MDGLAPETEELLQVIQDLSLCSTFQEVIDLTRRAARRLSGADGATFVLREEGQCYYIDEDAIGPLWKGRRFPIESCISGWAMLHKESVAIEDIFEDSRIPIDAYRVTFVKSLLIVPIRLQKPIGAIGIYWAHNHLPTAKETQFIEALAQSTSIALENVRNISQLKESNTAKDELLSIVAHELRTPLSAMKLQLQMLDRSLKKNNVVGPAGLDLSLAQINSLSSLVEQLVEVSKIQLHDLQLQFQEVSVAKFLQKSVKFWEPEMEKIGSRVQLTVEDDASGHWDERSLERVMNNLFSNIVKHAPGSNVSLIARTEGKFVHIFFQDNGPGIPEESHAQLFQLLERGIAPRYVRGLGLGLYVSKYLIEANGGEINIEGGPEEGTHFFIRLPISP